MSLIDGAAAIARTHQRHSRRWRRWSVLKARGAGPNRFRRQAAATAGRLPWRIRLTAAVLADDRFDRGDGPEPALRLGETRESPATLAS
jgi:hypothetical protein